jgi:hypothetical protein
VRHRRPSRRTPRALGAAAGGLLGAAFFPTATAFADDYTITGTDGPETITGIYGYGFDGADTAPPAVAGSTQGYQDFYYSDTTTDATGAFQADESTSVDGFGDTNQQVLVTADLSGSDAPPVGSVFDTYTFDDGQDESIYSAIPMGGGNYTITDTLVTPDGDETIPVTFNAADLSVADAGGVPIGDGDDIDPVGSQTLTSISGIPPLTMADQGTQTFDVTDGADTIGKFDAVNTETADGVGTYTEAVLVTKDLSGTVGTAAGDTPAVGSIFNTMDLGGDQLVYSDLVGSSGSPDVITDTLITPYGDDNIATTFDAAQAEDTAAIDVPEGADLTPVGSLAETGINGLPPVDVGIQGTQDFDFTNPDGTTGTLTADVTNTMDLFDDSTETVLVTSNADPDAPAGSVFETVTWGDTGYESVYSDIVSTTGGANTITETFVTPFGDVPIPDTLDAAANLANDLFSGI